MSRKTLEEVLHEVDPALKIARGRKRRATITEFEAMREVPVEERIRLAPAPRRLVRELDEWGNPGPPLVCPICRGEVEELYPYGYAGKRFACPVCIERRHSMLETKARILAFKRAPKAGTATRMRMTMIKYYAKRTPPT